MWPAPVDAVGCPSHEPGPSDNASAASLVPAGAHTISLCGYAGFSADHQSDFWLTSSAAAPANQVKTLPGQLDALPPGSLTGARPLHTYLRISYQNGHVRWLAVYATANTRDLVVTDGDHAGLAQDGGTSAAGNAVNELLYPGTGWPELAVPHPSSTAGRLLDH